MNTQFWVNCNDLEASLNLPYPIYVYVYTYIGEKKKKKFFNNIKLNKGNRIIFFFFQIHGAVR